jgi:predicted acetyltransferase
MKLVFPSKKYKNSFLQALSEYQSEKANDRLDIFTLSSDVLQNDFDGYVKRLENEAQGNDLPPGYVSHTTYWLVDNNEFIGRVDIRHTLTKHLLREGGHIGYDIRPSKRNHGYGKKILALALPKAKSFGIKNVLVTCDETNVASKKIIEANGGILENKISVGKGRPKKLRYWFSLC